jgi:transcriptional regulator GlxA family with amidase domain
MTSVPQDEDVDVVIVMFDGVQSVDVAGPAEVFAAAGHRVHTVSTDGRPVRAMSGLTLVPDGDLASARGPIDTLMVAGGEGTPAALADRRLIAWLPKAAARSRRVTSVCSGSFLLAEAGLLDGKRATTHWSVCTTLAELYPAVTVEGERIYVQDGDVWTSAGVTAGMDLALALVEADHGRDVALSIARRFVLFLRRPGSQAQFSAQLAAQVPERDALKQVQAYVAEHPGADLSVEALAQRAGMSVRNFARSFRAEVGATPARYVEAARVEAARRLLEETGDGVDNVAHRCGFGTAETMRRTFVRTLHVPPAEYRRRFATKWKAPA